MTRPGAWVALAASVLLLAGCAPAPDLPAPITYAEAKKRAYERNVEWWQSMFPDEPMPEVEPIEFLDPGEPSTKVIDCIRDAQVAGLTFAEYTEGGYTVSGADGDEFNRVQFVCALQYPFDLSDPANLSYLGMLSDEQLAWIWDYNRSRLVPCLRMLGYAVGSREGDYVPGNEDLWIPYFDMTPLPQTEEEWALLNLRCPPSPVGPVIQPGVF